MQLNKKSAAVAIGLAFAGSHQVWAVEADENIQKVKVTGHYDNAVGTSDAASQGTITADLIANRPALRTGDLIWH